MAWAVRLSGGSASYTCIHAKGITTVMSVVQPMHAGRQAGRHRQPQLPPQSLQALPAHRTCPWQGVLKLALNTL